MGRLASDALLIGLAESVTEGTPELHPISVEIKENSIKKEIKTFGKENFGLLDELLIKLISRPVSAI